VGLLAAKGTVGQWLWQWFIISDMIFKWGCWQRRGQFGKLQSVVGHYQNSLVSSTKTLLEFQCFGKDEY